jgi:hypothetical protein
MSAFDPKRTWADALQMSDIGGKADMPPCYRLRRNFAPLRRRLTNHRSGTGKPVN